MATIDRTKIEDIMKRELKRFAKDRPKSKALLERGKASLISGVPMAGMAGWAGSFPIYVKEAHGAYLTDVDGHRYLDLCLGDTGAMCGHTPQATIDAIIKQINKGFTYWLPTEDSIWVGEELTRRFKVTHWQLYLRASDANVGAIGVARDVTRRYPILIYDGSYHGHVPDTKYGLMNGEVWPKTSGVEDVVESDAGILWRNNHSLGPVPTNMTGTRIIQFNDLDALEKTLATREIACVLAEPAMTNVGIILPDPGYHTALRELTRKYGTLLIIDETHTWCSGASGLIRIWNLDPDIVTLGKPLAGGIATAVMGISDQVDTDLKLRGKGKPMKNLGGGTLSGNALSIAATRATLEHVLTDATFEHTSALCKRLADGVDKIISDNDLPWHVIRLGCRAEWRWSRTPPRNGKEAHEAVDPALHELVHLFFMNRGILLTPPHSMVLIAPDCTV
ncbi:MAG: transaminase, partial [Chloroflexi bacterium]|nr:transaminase [Chloroflexota bacterium]